jgi:hypothetical protein
LINATCCCLIPRIKNRPLAKKFFAEHAISRFLEKEVNLKANLEMLASELELLETIINQVSGPLASRSIERKLVLEYKILVLTNSRVAHGTEELLDKELKLAIMVQQQSNRIIYIGN